MTAPIVAVCFGAGFRMPARRDLSACADVKAHVLLEEFDVLKPRTPMDVDAWPQNLGLADRNRLIRLG
jgi:hypothetical protein